MEKEGKSAAVQIAAVFVSREHLDSGTVFWNRS